MHINNDYVFGRGTTTILNDFLNVLFLVMETQINKNQVKFLTKFSILIDIFNMHIPISQYLSIYII